MTQTALNIDAAKSAVLIMDFQQRIVNNVASEPEAVVRNAARALEGARAAGIPVIYVVHRGGPFAGYAPRRGAARRALPPPRASESSPRPSPAPSPPRPLT